MFQYDVLVVQVYVVPLAHGGTHAEDNLMALCKPCHSRITVEMGDRWPQNKEYTY